MTRWLCWLTKLELFEWVGLLATFAVAYIFFAFGTRLDSFTAVSGYHWKMAAEVVGIYLHFIPWAIACGFAVLAIAAVWLRRVPALRSQFLFGLRVFFAYCLLLIVFRVVNFYVPILHPGIRDSVIQALDVRLFGRPVAVWLEPLAAKWLTHVATGAYVSWFWLLFFTIVVLLLKSRTAATEYIFASLAAFYLGYIVYVLVPVIGPGYTMHFQVALGDIAPRFTLNRAQIARDCFPSLHTATSVIMCIYIWRWQRRWFVFYLPMAALIIFATLYLRIHYGLDDIAGAALGVVTAGFAPAVHGWWESVRQRVEIRASVRHTEYIMHGGIAVNDSNCGERQ